MLFAWLCHTDTSTANYVYEYCTATIHYNEIDFTNSLLIVTVPFAAAVCCSTKVVQYSGLKRTDDRYDAYFLAHLMRLNILPTGYICPVELRGLRDLSRKRMSLVQNRTQQILSIKTQYQRNTGTSLNTNELKLKNFQLPVVGDSNVQMAMEANFNIMKALSLQICLLYTSPSPRDLSTSRMPSSA